MDDCCLVVLQQQAVTFRPAHLEHLRKVFLRVKQKQRKSVEKICLSHLKKLAFPCPTSGLATFPSSFCYHFVIFLIYVYICIILYNYVCIYIYIYINVYFNTVHGCQSTSSGLIYESTALRLAFLSAVNALNGGTAWFSC